MSTRARQLYLRRIAIALHGNQMYGDFPYEFHLLAVVDAASRLVTSEMLAWGGIACWSELETALWFHDTLEDTEITLGVLTAIIGEKAASAVWSVTDAPGKNRKERKWGNDQHLGPMRKLPYSRFGLIVKLLDRIANAESSKAYKEKKNKGKFEMYRAEQKEFYETLYVRDTPIEPLWDHLNNILDFTPPTPVPNSCPGL